MTGGTLGMGWEGGGPGGGGVWPTVERRREAKLEEEEEETGRDKALKMGITSSDHRSKRVSLSKPASRCTWAMQPRNER